MAIDEPKSPTEELNESPLTTPMYVAWCDVMGASAMMKYSFRTARFRVFQFYTLVMSTMKSVEGVTVFTAGDGVFLASERYEPISAFLSLLMEKVQFVSQSKVSRGADSLAFLVRSAVAHGAVSVGVNESNRISRSSGVESVPHIIDNVIVGPPVSVAYHLERSAPPLGIILDISVLQRDTNLLGPFARWSRDPKSTKEYVLQYFAHQVQHKAEYGFDASKIGAYRELVEEYFR